MGILRKRGVHAHCVFWGKEWGGGTGYLSRIRGAAASVAGDRIHFPGAISPTDVPGVWPDVDCAVHVPFSENCGGVVEPMAAGCPVIASKVGGLQEVVFDGLTGRTVPSRDPIALADAMGRFVSEPEGYRSLAKAGQRLVVTMFDVNRTSREVFDIYRYVLRELSERPRFFDPKEFVQSNGGRSTP